MGDGRYYRWRHAIKRRIWVLDQHWYVLVGWLYLLDLAKHCTCCPCPEKHPPCPRHDATNTTIRVGRSWTHVDETRCFPNGRDGAGQCPVVGWREQMRC